MSKSKVLFVVLALALLVGAISLFSQAPGGQAPGAAPGGATGATGGRGGGPGMGGGTQTVDFDDMTGFTKIFNGKNLDEWDCATEIWSVEDGAIVAKSTPEKPSGTTFAVWKGGDVGDFELKLQFNVTANGGVQYRSTKVDLNEIFASMRGSGGPGGDQGGQRGARGQGDAGNVPGGTAGGDQGGQRGARGQGDAGDMPGGTAGGRGGDQGGGQGGPGGGMGTMAYSAWNVGGYQCDLAGTMSGQLFENSLNNRFIAVNVGQVMVLEADSQKRLIGTLGDDVLSNYKNGEWTNCHIIAKGHYLIHIINGRVACVAIDNDPERFKATGTFALQIEGNGINAYRNIYLKRL